MAAYRRQPRYKRCIVLERRTHHSAVKYTHARHYTLFTFMTPGNALLKTFAHMFACEQTYLFFLGATGKYISIFVADLCFEMEAGKFPIDGTYPNINQK